MLPTNECKEGLLEITKSCGRKGVSEVVGALALIIVVVIAVSSLALFISTVQRQEQNRLSQLDYIQKERLDIVSIEPIGNETHWKSIKVVVRNPGVYDSAIYRIAFNDCYAKEWMEGDRRYGIETIPLSVTQGETKSIVVDLKDMISGGEILRYDRVKVTIMTPSANFFTRQFSPPVAVASVGVETYRYGSGERDVLIFDGSGSFSNSSFVMDYRWRIDVPKDYLAVNWSDPESYATRYVSGAIFRYAPEALFDLEALSSLNATGPIRVSLTVSDSYGLLANSSPVIVPRNPRTVPPSHFIFGSPVHNGDSTEIKVSLFDIYNRPVNGSILNFAVLDSKNVSGINPFVARTLNGSVNLTINWVSQEGPGYVLLEVWADQLIRERIFVTKP